MSRVRAIRKPACAPILRPRMERLVATAMLARPMLAKAEPVLEQRSSATNRMNATTTARAIRCSAFAIIRPNPMALPAAVVVRAKPARARRARVALVARAALPVLVARLVPVEPAVRQEPAAHPAARAAVRAAWVVKVESAELVELQAASLPKVVVIAPRRRPAARLRARRCCSASERSSRVSAVVVTSPSPSLVKPFLCTSKR